MREVKVFSPATLANISCGFDVLGLAVENVGDVIVLRELPLQETITITKIEGESADNIPRDISKNVVGVVITAMLESLNKKIGLEIEIKKGIKSGSGIGSSSASAAGAAVALNELLGTPFKREELVYFAMQGEKAASGVAHADNVAPAVLGGITLVKSSNPLKVLQLPNLPELYVVLVHPFVEVKTLDSRGILKDQVLLKDAVKQAANLGSFVSALYTQNYELLAECLADYLVEPQRQHLIPFFKEVKELSKTLNILGFGISGSGPSTYMIIKGEIAAEKTVEALHTFYKKTDLNYDIHCSKINLEGVKVI